MISRLITQLFFKSVFSFIFKLAFLIFVLLYSTFSLLTKYAPLYIFYCSIESIYLLGNYIITIV